MRISDWSSDVCSSGLAYADMHDVAPAALGVGQPNEIIQPLPCGGYFIDGGGRAQSRMPGGAFFGAIGNAAGQQAFAQLRKIARRQQSFTSLGQFVGTALTADRKSTRLNSTH